MVDRLSDLKRNEAFNMKGESEMQREVQPVREKLEKLRSMTRELEELQHEYMTDNSKRAQKKIESQVLDISNCAADAKRMISQINDETQRLSLRGASDTLVRLRNNQYHVLSKQLLEVTKTTWDSQTQHSEKVKDMVTRRLKIRYTNADGTTLPDTEARQMASQLVNNNQQDQIFSLARDELVKAMKTQEEVSKIERSMIELHQMFCDLAVLVNEQGEGVAQTASNVEQAATRVEKGERELRLAKKYSRGCGCNVQ